MTTAVSAGIAVFPKVGQFFGLSSPTDAATFVTNVFGFIAVVAPLVASVARWKSKGQPLTLTATAAEEHPATIAVKQVQAEMAAAGIDTSMVRQAKIAASIVPPVVPSPSQPVIPVAAPVVAPKLTADDTKAIAEALYLHMAQAQQRARAAVPHPTPGRIINTPPAGGKP